MKVFVTGGTGVLGTATARVLSERGHTVTGLAHSEASIETLRGIGVEPVRGGLFDVASLSRAIVGVDAVLHLATRIPPISKMRKRSAWNENDRIRSEGTRNLVSAAIANGVEVIVYPSITLLYPDSGDRWIDSVQTAPDAIAFLTSTLEAESQIERFTSEGRRGVTLRLGPLYGPTSSQTQELLGYAGRGIAAVIGPDDAYYPSLWIDDAARAIVMAMEQASPGVYDVVDDEPLARRDLGPAMAAAVGRDRLRRLPGLLVRIVSGSTLVAINGRSQRVSNARFKDETGWEPSVKSAREGWRQLA